MRLTRHRPPTLRERVLADRQRIVLIAAVIVVVLTAAEVGRRRARRRGIPLGSGERPHFERDLTPDRPLIAPVAEVDAPLALGTGAVAVLDAPVIEVADDLDEAGAGLPVPASRAIEELRVERRFETVVFVRAVLILIGIALLLTARALYV